MQRIMNFASFRSVCGRIPCFLDRQAPLWLSAITHRECGAYEGQMAELIERLVTDGDVDARIAADDLVAAAPIRKGAEAIDSSHIGWDRSARLRQKVAAVPMTPAPQRERAW